MKANHFIQSLIFLLCIISCAGRNASEGKNNFADSTMDQTAIDSFATGKVIDTVICKDDASQSYALYIPVKGNTEALPVIYFFDPHGSGSFPLNKYKSLADQYNFILVGSNNSKNGNDLRTSGNIITTLFNDTQKRLKINNSRIYTGGFSGGAKVASYAALTRNDIHGIIIGGAGLPDGTASGNFNFSITILSGKGDMNLTDLIALNNNLDKTSTVHRIVFFDGKHAWSLETIMNTAFEGLQLDAMRQKIIVQDVAFINNYIAEAKKKVDDYSKTNKLLDATDECKLSITMLNNLSNEINWFKEKESLIEKSSAYQQQLNQSNNLLKQENALKAFYQQQFRKGDMSFWTKTINELKVKAQVQSAEGAMYQRLMAYLSLAFYSISNNLIHNNQNEGAKYFVTLYKMDDPENSDAWYFSAILNARNNDAKTTQDDLLNAAQYGFTDINRMLQQPEFQHLSSALNFSVIESKMNKATN